MLQEMVEDVDLAHLLVEQVSDESLCVLVMTAKAMYFTLRMACCKREMRLLFNMRDFAFEMTALTRTVSFVTTFRELDAVCSKRAALATSYRKTVIQCKRLEDACHSMSSLKKSECTRNDKNHVPFKK